MALKKRFALTVAKPCWTSATPIVVAHIPWDQFQAEGGPSAYVLLIERTGANAVIVSKPPGGRWESITPIRAEWEAICKVTPLETLEWQTMPIESDLYPWELFKP